MNRILVELFLPAADQRYDIYVPADMRIVLITQLLLKLVEQESDKFIPSSGTLLVDAQTGSPLDISATPEELKIKNATRWVML